MFLPPIRRYATASLISLSAASLGMCALLLPSTPAQAIVVFDPTNYSQNVLTAVRTLQQVNNQIRSLQNEAQSLINQARNLRTITFPELRAITDMLQEIDTLMRKAKGIEFRIADLDRQFDALFPQDAGPARRLEDQVAAAQMRRDTEMAAYRQTMGVQAQIVENVEADARLLNSVVARSQNAEGSLQVGQATNQLLALAAKQQFQLQTLMAAQYRAQAIEQARRLQAQADARASAVTFLGSGSAYTPR